MEGDVESRCTRGLQFLEGLPQDAFCSFAAPTLNQEFLILTLLGHGCQVGLFEWGEPQY